VLNRYKYCPLCGNELKKRELEVGFRECCSNTQCGYVNWDNPIPVVLALIEYRGKYIVTHNVEWPSWKYSLISGFLDAKEDPELAVRREIKEEVGLFATYTQLITISIYEKLNQLMISYYAKSDGEIELNEEHDSYKLLTLDELKNWEFGKGATPIIEKWLKMKMA